MNTSRWQIDNDHRYIYFFQGFKRKHVDGRWKFQAGPVVNYISYERERVLEQRYRQGTSIFMILLKPGSVK